MAATVGNRKCAQKNFTAFMLELHTMARVKPDAPYFQRLVSKGILFRRTERIVSAQEFGGYRANIVTYAIAKLSHATQQRLDLHRIWENQALDEALETAIADLAHMAFRVLTQEGGAQNVTEWAKREVCWRTLREASWDLPPAVGELLVPLRGDSVARGGAGSTMEGALPEHDPVVSRMNAVEGDAFLAISNWAKETDNLTPWDRRFAYSIGARLNRGSGLTSKQAAHAERILEAVRALGFDPTASGEG